MATNKNFTNWNIQNYSEDVTNLNITQALLVKASDNSNYDYTHADGDTINHQNPSDNKVVKLLVDGAAVFSHDTDSITSNGTKCVFINARKDLSSGNLKFSPGSIIIDNTLSVGGIAHIENAKIDYLMVDNFEPEFLEAVNLEATNADIDILSVTGSAGINNLSVSGYLRVNDTLTVNDDEIICNKDLSISSGNLFIDNISRLNYNAPHNNILIKDNTHIEGNLYVSGSLQNDGLIEFSDVYIKDNIHIGQNQVAGDDSYVFLGHTKFSTHSQANQTQTSTSYNSVYFVPSRATFNDGITEIDTQANVYIGSGNRNLGAIPDDNNRVVHVQLGHLPPKM